MSQPFLFVSHVTEDRAAATELVTELERRGIGCWVAPRDVRAGKPYDDEIAEAIDGLRGNAAVFSERCNESEYIRREITVAGEARKLIIPFRIEDAQPKRGLRIRLADLHWIDGFIAREQAIDALIRSVLPKCLRVRSAPRPELGRGGHASAAPRPARHPGQGKRLRAGSFGSPTRRNCLRSGRNGIRTRVAGDGASADPEDQFLAGVMHRVGFASLSSWREAIPFFHGLRRATPDRHRDWREDARWKTKRSTSARPLLVFHSGRKVLYIRALRSRPTLRGRSWCGQGQREGALTGRRSESGAFWCRAGLSVPKDDQQAMVLFRKAAELGL